MEPAPPTVGLPRMRQITLFLAAVWVAFGAAYGALGRDRSALVCVAVGIALGLAGGVGDRARAVRARFVGGINLVGLLVTATLGGGPRASSAWWVAAIPIVVGLVDPGAPLVVWSLVSAGALALCAAVVAVLDLPPEYVQGNAELLATQWTQIAVVAATVALARAAWFAKVRELEAHRGVLQAQARDLVRARDEAVDMARGRMHFAATLAHEVRTPLHGMLGIAQLLLDSATQRDRDLARTMVAAGRSLQGAVDDILEFSRIEAEGLTVERVPFDPGRQIEEVLQLFAIPAWERGLDLAWPADPAAPARILGDPTRFRQALSNLVGNAVKFTERGSVVVRMAPRDGRLRVAVQDTGIGVSPDEQERLFRPFTQANADISRRYGGTGLGLSLVKRVVDQMGGAVGVESEPGVGSTFWFELPMEGAESTEPDTVVGAFAVLVDERRPATREAVVRRLQSWGCAVTIARSATDWERRDWRVALVGPDAIVPLAIGDRPVVRLSPDPRPAAADGRPVLATPFRAADLKEALRAALGGARPGGRGTAFDADLGRRHPLRVLVVDDSETNRRVASLMLGRLGYAPDLATDGAEAVEAVIRRPYDLVLMDLVMPGMDGVTASRRIREVAPATRIVAMTANLLPGQERELVALGVTDLLRKPVVVEELVAALSASPAGEWAPDDPLPTHGIAEVLSLCAGDRDKAIELTRSFLDSLDGHLARIRAAGEDRDAIHMAAHAIRGSAAIFGAADLGEAAGRLERDVKAGAWSVDEVLALGRAVEDRLAWVRADGS